MTEADALSAFVASRISFHALRNALSDSTSFVFLPNGTVHITSRRPLPVTLVHPEDVRRVLSRYRRGELTVEELTMWGIILHGLDAFEITDANEATEEAVWDVIGQLVVASADETFDEARVSLLLKRLTENGETA